MRALAFLIALVAPPALAPELHDRETSRLAGWRASVPAIGRQAEL